MNLKYCTNCGSQINEQQDICLSCGKLVKQNNQVNVSHEQDSGGFGWALLGFFIPFVGLILYLMWKDERPLTAKSTGKGAIAGVVFSVVSYIFLIIFLAFFY